MILNVSDKNTGYKGQYNMMIETDEFDDTFVYLGDIHSRKGACVVILIDKHQKESLLQTALYRPSCDISGNMQSHTGTIIMIQAALKYVIQKYKTIEYITLNDKSLIPEGNIHVTAKRLLQKRKGWYEEYLGAIPDTNDFATKRLMRIISSMNVPDDIMYKMQKRTWGTTEDILEVAPVLLGKDAKYIIGTSWKIEANTINNYPIKIKISKPQIGGEIQKNHTIKIFEMWKKLCNPSLLM